MFRTLLFKVFNRIDTWQRLVYAFGDVTVESFSVTNYDAGLSSAIERGERLYSAAYIMPTAPRRNERDRKHTSTLLIEQMISIDCHRNWPKRSRWLPLLACYARTHQWATFSHINL